MPFPRPKHRTCFFFFKYWKSKDKVVQYQIIVYFEVHSQTNLISSDKVSVTRQIYKPDNFPPDVSSDVRSD